MIQNEEEGRFDVLVDGKWFLIFFRTIDHYCE